METTFLEKLAQEVYTLSQGKLDNACFVFPSKRSGLFFKKELAKLYNEPFWAPEVLTITEFVEQLSGLTTISQLEQAFLLFEIHQKSGFQPQLSFEKFMDQSKIILADFNDIDMALVDADQLFANVKDYVSLEKWDPETGQGSLTEKYLESWENLPHYYHAYQELLIKKGKAYQGLIYRHLEEKLKGEESQSVLESMSKWDSLYLAGLNALTPAEKSLFDWLKENKGLKVYYDAESQMILDSEQESGRFIRKFVKEEKGDFKWSVDRLTNSKKQINTYAVNGNLAIARSVGKLFSDKDSGLSSNQETAIILADENLLMPVLESIPANISEVNVTLGFPLGLTPFMSLVEQIFSMQQMSRANGNKVQFYFKDVLKVFTNPVLVRISEQASQLHQISTDIIHKNEVWIEGDELNKKLLDSEIDNELNWLCSDWSENPKTAVSFLEATLNRYQNNLEGKHTDDILTEQLYFFKTSLNTLQEYIQSYSFHLSLDAIRKIFKHVVSLLEVPFSGEPLAGIQIMGLLETRLLSFKNVVFLSVNEGVIPSKGGFQSFLPFNLRRAYGIQTHQDRESLFAYHFYRVLSQAENIHLVYNTAVDGIGANEKSRFIRQIEQEWPSYSPDITFNHHVGVFDNEKMEIHQEIEKTPEVIANITKYLTDSKRGLSPSGLNAYLESPVDFYYKSVARIQEPKVVDEEMEHNTFGTIVHNCLEMYYNEFENRVLSVFEMKKKFAGIDKVIEEVFTKEIPDHNRGKHFLSYYSARKYVRRFIQLDIGRVEASEFPITLEKNELELNTSVKVGGLDIRLKGFADRVEKSEGATYIIDYKTGNVKSADLKIESYTDLSDKHKPKLIQLLMYAWLANKQLSSDKVVSGIYTLRATEMNLLKATVNKNSQLEQDDFVEIENYVTSIIKEMLNPEVPLTVNPEYQFGLF